jgi:hypothetical protein
MRSCGLGFFQTGAIPRANSSCKDFHRAAWHFPNGQD